MVWVPFGAANWPAKITSISPGCAGKAVVQLYASGISTEVNAAGLTAFADDCQQKCRTMQSQLGQQVGLPQLGDLFLRLSYTAAMAVIGRQQASNQ